MTEIPKSSILEKYHRAISALPPEEQIRRADKIKSPKTLRRFLSAEAPDALMVRFAPRLNEIMDQGLTSYEIGRVLIAGGDKDEAQERFKKAIKTGDKRGHLGMAQVLCSANTDEDDACALEHLGKVGNDAATDKEVNFIRGEIHFLCGDDENARLSYEKAAISSPDPQGIRDYVRGMVLVVESKRKRIAATQGIVTPNRESFDADEKQGLALLEPLAEKGDINAIVFLIKLNIDGSRPDKLEKYLLLGAKYGMTAFYSQLGRFYLETVGDKKKALHAFRMAVAAGYNKEVAGVVQLMIEEENDVAGAEKVSRDAIAKGEPMGYMALANVLAYLGRRNEAFSHIEQAHKKGVRLPPEFILPMLIEKGRLAEAERICKKNESKIPRLILFRVIIALEKNDNATASKLTEKFLRLTGKMGEIEECRAMARRGQTTEAMQRLIFLLTDVFSGIAPDSSMFEKILKGVVNKRLN